MLRGNSTDRRSSYLSDDEIVMPEGPPPDSDEDSDDSIVMPEGPPPPEAKLYPSAGEASSSGTSGGMPLLPPGKQDVHCDRSHPAITY